MKKNLIIVAVSLLVLILVFSGVLNIAPTSAVYSLDSARYYSQVKAAFNLSLQQETSLAKNGFVVVESQNDSYFEPKLRFEDFYFTQVYGKDLPVFITTDSILHLFHVVFDCSLRILENRSFYPTMLNITQFAFNKSLTDYNAIPHDYSPRYWAVRNSTVYFGVGLSLLTNFAVSVPTELESDLNFFLNNTLADNPEFVYAGGWVLPVSPWGAQVRYDFTQFTVRGHYLGLPLLEQYFRAFMWYGYMPIFVPRVDETYLWTVPHFNETTIVYMRDMLRSNPEVFQKWMLLYNVTSGFVGESDSVGPVTLELALHDAFGDSDTYLDTIVTGSGLLTLKNELEKPQYAQRILSQALIAVTGGKLARYPLIFQFMGQRYVPDSFIFQQLCWDKVGLSDEHGRRIMPKGLDVFAALGSERAAQLLIPDCIFENFTRNLETLKGVFQNVTEEAWTQSSYLAWIHALQGLVSSNQSDSLPEFMKTLAWQDEKLNTALASWAQLRHDTLLYAKQTYIPGILCSYPEAFVEPYPVFYSAMHSLVQRTIETVNMLSPESVSSIIPQSLDLMNNITQKLEIISLKEIAQEPLTLDEVGFMKRIVWYCGTGGFIGWYVDTIHAIANAANYTSLLNTPIIADVATFGPGDYQIPPQILHVGTGYVNALIVLYPSLNGSLVTSVGPVFSYYEFPLVGTKRLNDEEWKTILASGNGSRYLPSWFLDIYGSADAWVAPEYQNFAIIAAVLLTVSSFTILFRKWTRTRKLDECTRGLP